MDDKYSDICPFFKLRSIHIDAILSSLDYAEEQLNRALELIAVDAKRKFIGKATSDVLQCTKGIRSKLTRNLVAITTEVEI